MISELRLISCLLNVEARTGAGVIDTTLLRMAAHLFGQSQGHAISTRPPNQLTLSSNLVDMAVKSKQQLFAKVNRGL